MGPTRMTSGRPVLYTLTAFLAAFLVSVSVQADYIFNAFLLWDDAIYVTSAWFGDGIGAPTHPAIYWFLEAVAPYASPAALKVVSVAFIGGIAAVSCLWLILFNTPPLAAVLLGAAIALYPVAVDQGLFVTATHPTVGSLFSILSAYLICATWMKSTPHALLGAAAACGFAILARLTSPSFLLGAGIPLIMTVGCWMAYRPPGRKMLAIALVALTPLVVTFAYGVDYHYTSAVGWTGFTAARVLENLGLAVRRILKPLVLLGPAPLTLLVAALLVAGAAAVRHWTVHRENLILGLCLLVCAAVSFGPSSVTTSYLDRYAVAPFILTLLALATMAGPSLARMGRGWSSAASAAGVLVIAATVTAGAFQRTISHAGHLATYEVISRLVSATAGTWPRDSQVVIALPKDLNSPTAGYNHWSTWYARYLANRRDIIALIGDVQSLDKSPFVARYEDHGPIYWEVERGRSIRVPMRGLELDRPLFAYEVHAPGRPADHCPVDVAFNGPKSWTVRPGQRIGNGTAVTLAGETGDAVPVAADCREEKPRPLVWAIAGSGVTEPRPWRQW